jgi:hypothetical protein
MKLAWNQVNCWALILAMLILQVLLPDSLLECHFDKGYDDAMHGIPGYFMMLYLLILHA